MRRHLGRVQIDDKNTRELLCFWHTPINASTESEAYAFMKKSYPDFQVKVMPHSYPADALFPHPAS